MSSSSSISWQSCSWPSSSPFNAIQIIACSLVCRLHLLTTMQLFVQFWFVLLYSSDMVYYYCKLQVLHICLLHNTTRVSDCKKKTSKSVLCYPLVGAFASIAKSHVCVMHQKFLCSQEPGGRRYLLVELIPIYHITIVNSSVSDWNDHSVTKLPVYTLSNTCHSPSANQFGAKCDLCETLRQHCIFFHSFIQNAKTRSSCWNFLSN